MTAAREVITSADSPAFDELCASLAELAGSLPGTDPSAWPEMQLQLCGQYGVFEWFAPRQWGGQDWDDLEITRGYLRISTACLTTAFILTQFTGALRRLAAAENKILQNERASDLVSGRRFVTLAISHLTTSRRHLAQPVLRAQPADGGYLLEGYSPWVTGAQAADLMVTGGTLPHGEQILVALPTDAPGVSVQPAAALVGLSASQTGPVMYNRVYIPRAAVLAGPGENVLQSAAGAQTGGLQTSTLAVGLANAAITFLEGETAGRTELGSVAEALRAEQQQVQGNLLAIAAGESVCTTDELRTRANSLALRATQAALTAAKGTGYVAGHPAGR